ncbi:serine hydrolase domain-containing protein [Lewinella sp. LCG006]|uniref:serine hydrolase domain-containing protein n=1 Tax=Lewinella sp. LCG006 TaxID=3231911 RepID=UPI0034611BA7
MKNYYWLVFLFMYALGNAQVDTMFTRAAQYGHFNGVVIVQDSLQRQYEICEGDARPGISITTDTPFDIGSLTKQFTAAAILQLVDEGKVELHTPVNQYLGELASKRWRKVTLHHLLTHTSGIPSLYQTEQGLETFFPEAEPISRAMLVQRFQDAKLQFSPGEEFAYSNSGYILLAVVVEKISGLSFGDFLTQKIFRPYGLSSASWGQTAESALPYYGYRSDLKRPAPVYHPSWMVGAGGVYASAEDLVRWVEVIQSDTFLNTTLREEYLRSHTRAGYAYGWQRSQEGHVEHDGINTGFAAFVSFDPSTRQQIVILTNRGFEPIHLYGNSAAKIREWATAIWAHLNGESIPSLPARVNRVLAHGAYTLPDGDTLHLTPADTVIRLSIKDRYPSRIVTNTPLKETTAMSEKLTELCRYLRRGKYWKIAKYCDGEMKVVAYTGLLSVGFKMMKKKTGDLQEIIPYFVNEQYGLARMNGSEGVQDIIFYFDEEGRVQGIFEHKFYLPEKQVEMYAYPTADGFYLDGFPDGEDALEFSWQNDSLYFQQYGRTLVLPKL